MATYELWNVESGALLGTFPDETVALDAVSEAIGRNGDGFGALLALGRESSRGDSKIIASGPELVERAMRRKQTPGGDRTTRRSVRVTGTWSAPPSDKLG